MVSRIGLGRYILMAFYYQLVVVILVFPLMMGMIDKDWAMVAVVLAIFVVLAWPLGMIVHARNAVIDEQGKKRWG